MNPYLLNAIERMIQRGIERNGGTQEEIKRKYEEQQRLLKGGGALSVK
ncbi:hypothetical protein [Peribacillus simplex]|uniref:Uncharacterized protein n=1 Tax=Peribacillus simplex TaxID=1478 RepID=A0AAN2PF89_9BACI|nr:hypothetical protein [Peribacillus simplex]CEG31479.1 hypothetical protein BN1180_01623 [Peribacillus simplex]